MSIFGSFFHRNPHNKISKPARDPVCGMNATAGITSEYQGQSYYFCSEYCKEQFDEDPAAYV